MIGAIDLLSGMIEGLGDGMLQVILEHSKNPGPDMRQLLLHCMKDAYPDVRQSTFALVGKT